MFLLAGDKFMPEMHLRHVVPEFRCSACGPLTQEQSKNAKFKRKRRL